jgi:hypothetical protein
MIILGWIGFFLLIVSVVGALSKSKYETFLESCVGVVGAMLVAFTTVGCAFGIVYLVTSLLIATFGDVIVDSPRPTVLQCNGVVVAESINGFYYQYKANAYRDHRNNLTYTPRRGEVCKELLKESK